MACHSITAPADDGQEVSGSLSSASFGAGDNMKRIMVGHINDIPPGSMRLVSVGPYGIGVFNVDGEFYALLNYCIHQGAPVCSGRITGTGESPDGYEVRLVRQGEILRCPWHAWEFEISTGRALTQPTRQLKTYPVKIENGMVVVTISGPADNVQDEAVEAQ